jgi:predicted permease
MQQHRVWRQVVDETFLGTMGIRVLRGRAIAASDTAGAAAAAVINEALARQLFGTSDVVGRQFRLGLRTDTPLEIVGVAADARYTSMRADPPPTAYLSYRQQPVSAFTLEVRTEGDAKAMAPTIREAMREVDAALPLVDLRTQDDQILASLTEERLFAGLATLLGAVTLLLSGIGVYGLLAYAVTRRTQEIGVRMALGAARGSVRWMILRQSLVLAGIGLGLGIPAAMYGTRVVESMLFGLTPRDPVTIAAAALVMALVALAAAYLPARRASRVDPIVALRQ